MSEDHSIVGKRFGRWTVLENKGSQKLLCRCDCGTTKTIFGPSLTRTGPSVSKSCGCLRKQVHTTHGDAAGYKTTPEYAAWQSMKQRCNDRNFRQFEDYGGRGITICERWQGEMGYVHFRRDMGPRPSFRHSLDRIDNNGNYEPGNCRWANSSQQRRNSRSNRNLTLEGRTQCITDWAAELGISASTLYHRMKAGLSFEQAILKKLHSRTKPRTQAI